jgi:hypothetical protein
MSINNYAIIDGNEVVNVILLDEDFDDFIPPTGCELKSVPEYVTIGWTWIDELWKPPIVPDQNPEPVEDPAITEAKENALITLMDLGIDETIARTIVGLPASET